MINEMKEAKFDRERFLRGEMPTRTRGGWKVLKVVDSGLDIERPIVAWIDGFVVPESYSRDGFCLSNLESGLDLVHEPKMRKVQVLVYRTHRGVIGAVSDEEVKDSERFCDELKTEGRLLHRIEVEVPE